MASTTAVAAFGVPGPQAERLAILLPGWEGKLPTNARVDRSAYCVAAYTWHYGERLDPEARRGLLGYANKRSRETGFEPRET